MLKTTYIEAVFNDQYYRCEEMPDQQSYGFVNQWFNYGQNLQQSCGAENLNRLGLGAAHSLRDELRLYIGLLTDLYMDSYTAPTAKERNAEKTRIQEISQRLLQSYDVLLASTSILDNQSRGNFYQKVNLAIQQQQELSRLFIDPNSTDLLRPDQQIADRLLGRIGPIFNELNTFLTIVGSFDLSSADMFLEESLEKTSASQPGGGPDVPEEGYDEDRE